MLDFTKNIPLDPAWQKKYLLARGFLHLLFFAGALYFADIVLFPSQFFSYDTENAAPKNNAILNAEISENKINFDVFSDEHFSTAEIRLYFENDFSGAEFGNVKIRKTYKAFSYPEAKGLPLIPKESSRFANGSLVSFDNAVFIIDNGQAFPFKDPQTFISLGYDWNDVVPIQESELGMPRSNILFTADHPHPDGTVFVERENGKYYLINNSLKQEIANSSLLKNYLRGNPILADETSLDFQNFCKLNDTLIELGSSYYCSIPVADLSRFLGNNYQFEINGLPEEKIEKIEVEFSRKINWLNLRDSLSKIKHGILINFGYEGK